MQYFIVKMIRKLIQTLTFNQHRLHIDLFICLLNTLLNIAKGSKDQAKSYGNQTSRFTALGK